MHGMYSFPLRKYKRTKSLSFVSLKIASAPELHPSLVNTLRAHCLLLAPTFIRYARMQHAHMCAYTYTLRGHSYGS